MLRPVLTVTGTAAFADLMPVVRTAVPGAAFTSISTLPPTATSAAAVLRPFCG